MRALLTPQCLDGGQGVARQAGSDDAATTTARSSTGAVTYVKGSSALTPKSVPSTTRDNATGPARPSATNKGSIPGANGSGGGFATRCRETAVGSDYRVQRPIGPSQG